MKIIAAKVNYNENFDNAPDLYILVDKIPSRDELVYTKKEDNGGASYFAEKDGYVNFFHYSPDNERGYGGSLFTGKLDTGEEFKVRGPWSSNSSYMSSIGFTRSQPVTITDDPEVWERGYTFYAGHITGQIEGLVEHSFNLGWSKTEVRAWVEIKYPDKTYPAYSNPVRYLKEYQNRNDGYRYFIVRISGKSNIKVNLALGNDKYTRRNKQFEVVA